MKTFYIYDMQTDNLIGTVEAANVISAERKACEKYNTGSDEIYALSERY